MKDFIDRTAEQSGTKIDRQALMAMQGFIGVTTSVSSDGSVITETNSDGHTLTTTFNANGSITERFVGQKTITKTINFDSNGNVVSEVIS